MMLTSSNMSQSSLLQKPSTLNQNYLNGYHTSAFYWQGVSYSISISTKHWGISLTTTLLVACFLNIVETFSTAKWGMVIQDNEFHTFAHYFCLPIFIFGNSSQFCRANSRVSCCGSSIFFLWLKLLLLFHLMAP